MEHISTQIDKDILYKNEKKANPYWHFEHDPRVAPEMKTLIDRLDDADIPWTWGPNNPFD